MCDVRECVTGLDSWCACCVEHPLTLSGTQRDDGAWNTTLTHRDTHTHTSIIKYILINILFSRLKKKNVLFRIFPLVFGSPILVRRRITICCSFYSVCCNCLTSSFYIISNNKNIKWFILVCFWYFRNIHVVSFMPKKSCWKETKLRARNYIRTWMFFSFFVH